MLTVVEVEGKHAGRLSAINKEPDVLAFRDRRDFFDGEDLTGRRRCMRDADEPCLLRDQPLDSIDVLLGSTRRRFKELEHSSFAFELREPRHGISNVLVRGRDHLVPAPHRQTVTDDIDPFRRISRKGDLLGVASEKLRCR
jgi:hypothetical protein